MHTISKGDLERILTVCLRSVVTLTAKLIVTYIECQNVLGFFGWVFLDKKVQTVSKVYVRLFC